MSGPFGTFSLADIAMQTEQIGALRDQRQARQTERESTAKLTSLLPQAVQGDAQARQDIANIGTDKALEWYGKLEERDRTRHAEQVKDASAAVRWADTPEKWAQVQQHYGHLDPQIASIPFEAREQLALELGQIGAYMESAPKLDIRATEPGGGLYGVNPHTGQTQILVQPNPGDAPMGQPAGESRKTVNGKTYVKRGDQWFEEGGASNGSATF